MSKIKLGNKVRDKVTGFEGIATAKVEYITGCDQYCVNPGVGKDGEIREGVYIDVMRLEVVDQGISIEVSATAKPGGPQMDCPQR